MKVTPSATIVAPFSPRTAAVARLGCVRAALPAIALLALAPSIAYAQCECPSGGEATAAATTTTVAQPVTEPPPALPDYEQPPIPAPGYLWTPGYWAHSETASYYWVPGTWVQPPSPGLLWTPGYWGMFNGAYIFSAGYWGPHVGFYGGVNYGFGYGGVGFEGGRWDHGVFSYNRAVNNFGSVHIDNVYNKTVINNNSRVSFNGGNGGVNARPTAEEEAALHDHRDPPTRNQIEHLNAARNDPSLRASENHGHPAIAATAKPGEFKEGVVAARGAPGEAHTAGGAENHAPESHASENHGTENHAPDNSEAHPATSHDEHPAAGTEAHPNTGAADHAAANKTHTATPQDEHPAANPESHTPTGATEHVATPHPTNPASGTEGHGAGTAEHATSPTGEAHPAATGGHESATPERHTPAESASHEATTPHAVSPAHPGAAQAKEHEAAPHAAAEHAAPHSSAEATRPAPAAHPEAHPAQHPEEKGQRSEEKREP